MPKVANFGPREETCRNIQWGVYTAGVNMINDCCIHRCAFNRATGGRMVVCFMYL